MFVFATTAFTISSLITPPSRFRGPMLEAAARVVKTCRLIYTLSFEITPFSFPLQEDMDVR
jgi:hypothetical protein